MKETLYVILDISSLVMFLVGSLFVDYNFMLLGILLLLCGNFLFALTKIKRYIIFFLFNVSMFLFLIGRPFVSMIRGDEWWTLASKSSVYSALIGIYLSLLFMYIGANFFDKIFLTKSVSMNYRSNIKNKCVDKVFINNLQKVAMNIFYISIIASFMEGWEKIVFMQTHSYTQFYTNYQTTQSTLVKGFIQLMKPSLCIFLATMPTKKKARIPLVLFFISSLPQLVVGMRSPTMLAAMFIFSYYFLRDVYQSNENEKWIGKMEKTFIIVAIPFVVVFLYGYNFWRNGRMVDSSGGNLIFNFLYQQGNSFDVLVQGFEVMSFLPKNTFPGYMFGPIYDNFVYNSLAGRLLFDTISINNQSIEALQVGHDMKAHLSYIIMGNNYLQGAGVGVVHILEVVHDIGWFGLLCYNVLLGLGMVKMVNWFGKSLSGSNWITVTLCIYVLLQIYYTPRSDAIYMIAPVFSLYFWISIVICIFLAKLKKQK